MNKKPTAKLTPIFDIESDGLPIRAGIYQTSAAGWPDHGYSLQYGYCYWNGRSWSRATSSPQEAYQSRQTVGFPAPTRWRGVVPGKSYDFSLVPVVCLPARSIFAGSLFREGAQDSINVAKLEETESGLDLQMMRSWGSREPIEFQLTLRRSGSAYVGVAHGRVRGYPAPTGTEVHVRLTPRGLRAAAVITLIERQGSFEFSGLLETR